MKDVLKTFRIIAFVAVIGFSFAALSLTGCGGGDDSPPIFFPINPGGTLTVTDIPSDCNGQYALVLVNYLNIYGCESVTSEVTMSGKGVKISNGSVNIPMWIYNDDGSLSRYSGNEFLQGVQVGITPQQNISLMSSSFDGILYNKITFNSGSATVSYNDANGTFWYNR